MGSNSRSGWWVGLLVAGCWSPAGSTPSAYRLCDEAAPCPRDAECVIGLCLPRCGAGPACVEGAVCRGGACDDGCGPGRPCEAGYRCDEGSCGAAPCAFPDLWPYRLASDDPPAVIHYRHPSEASVAEETLALLRTAWQIQTGPLGFDPPPSDEGRCGPDGRFDVFLWRSYRGGGADAVGPVAHTPWDDAATFLLLDPWGPYGGEHLDTFVAHELHHALQAAHDWNEHNLFFEMTAQYVEERVHPDDDAWMGLLGHYQAHPDWAFDRDDDWESEYFYGAALYLHFLFAAYPALPETTLAELWRECRNPPGENEPDFVDALDTVLRRRLGVPFLDTLPGFARWRWYVGPQDDGRHFPEGGAFPPEATPAVAARLPGAPGLHRVAPGPMRTGTVFVEVERPAEGEGAVFVEIEPPPEGVRWSVQAVPGLVGENDGETFDPPTGPFVLRFGPQALRTLVILALPDGPDDPDERTDERFPLTLRLETVAGGEVL